MFTNKLKKNMAKDNRSLLDILEDMGKAEKKILQESAEVKKEDKEKSFFNDAFSTLYIL